ncbi:hypothetical protein BGZ60DRAFT_425347 [Tricladium varicosporioides]|nr:hypothetical protein BGZ60DRAFT_425347 [Hymenoscyphus varicosporioides]
MSPNKRRKLDKVPQAPRLSAVAARRALQAKAQDSAPGNRDTEDVSTQSESSNFSVLKRVDSTPQVPMQTGAKSRSKINESRQTPQIPTVVDESVSSDLSQSREASPEVLVNRHPVVLSSFKPSKENVKQIKEGVLAFKLVPGERLVILGQYGISVQKGQITILGSTLKASKTIHKIFAPCSHSLPVIRCLAVESNKAEICLHQSESGLGSMDYLSPLFGKLWNESPRGIGTDFESILKKQKPSTYQILPSSGDDLPSTYLQPLISAPEWNALLSTLTDPAVSHNSAIMICGPKSSGKSTFAKIFANRLLSIAAGSSLSGVAILDLDPGQPEFSPPGQLSLVRLVEPNFGPPFAHPVPSNRNQIIRSHAIGSLSPALDPTLYMACVVDLFMHYKNLLSKVPKCPLILNTPGWVLGTGLELLIELITKIQPTGTIYMSDEGPNEVVSSLRAAAKSAPVYTLPSQVSEYTTRTAVHLRTMQVMSYFHLNPKPSKTLTWNNTPLSSIPPWEIRYSGENAGILGIICYGEQPPANLLAETINGSLVAIVVIEDMAAIPGWTTQGQTQSTNDEELPDAIDENFISLSEPIQNESFDDDELYPTALEKPPIVQTLNECLPYFNPANTISLDPRYSSTIGLALVRCIDVPRKRLQILTPIDKSVVEDINESGMKIVLIHGKLDTPGWAYTEELHFKNMARKRGGGGSKLSDDEEEEEDEDVGVDEFEDRGVHGREFGNAPWVEKLDGSQGRGIGARVWRVRRDLGRMTEGGG